MNAPQTQRFPLLENEVPAVETGFAALRNLLDKMEQDSKSAAKARDDAERGAPVAPPAPVTGPVTKRRRSKTTMSTATAAAAPGSNRPTLEQILEAVRELGEKDGQGSDSPTKLMLKAVESGFLGAVDRVKNKHGDGVDDAMKMAEAYLTGKTKSGIFNRKLPTSRKTASNIRRLIDLGQVSTLGPTEPMASVNRLVNMWRDSRKNNLSQMEELPVALQRFARAQLKRDSVFDDGELKQFVFKPGREQRDDEDVIVGVRNTINKLIAGKLDKGNLKNDMAEVKSIANACTRALAAIAKARGGGQQATQSAPSVTPVQTAAP